MGEFIYHEVEDGAVARQRRATARSKLVRRASTKVRRPAGDAFYLSPDKHHLFFALRPCAAHMDQADLVMTMQDRGEVMRALGDCGCSTTASTQRAYIEYQIAQGERRGLTAEG